MLPRSPFVALAALSLLFGGMSTPTAAESPICASAPSGLVHWYRAEADPNDSIGTRHAILQNGTSFGPGKVGQAFQLDGANDYVDLGNWFDLQVFTVAMWVKAGATQQTYADIMDNNHTDGRSWVIQYQNTGLQFIWGIAQRGFINFSLTPDTWQFLVVTFDANYVGRLYLDGELKGSFQGNGPVVYDGTQFLRLSAWGGGGRFFNGEIDEVDIYDRALSQVEVIGLWQSGSAGKCITCEPTPNGIASWWSFDGNGNDTVGTNGLTLRNGAVFGAGKVAQGLQFDGVDDYAQAAAGAQWRFGTNDFTIELWAKFNSLRVSSVGNPAAVFAASDDGPGQQNKWLFELGGGTLTFHINSPLVGAKFLALAPFEPVFGQWYHLAVTRDATGYRIFSNGTQIGFESDPNPVPDVSAPLTIGQAEGLGYIDGAIDELAIYQRALTPGEIARIFSADEAGKCGPQSGLPDLQITSVSAPDYALAGTEFEISITVTNSGTAPAPGNWLNAVYLSTDSLSGADVFLGDIIVPSSLSAGASMMITQIVTAPLISGDFFIIAAADSDGRIAEEKEGNNWLATQHTLTLPAGLHLALSSGTLNEDDTNQIVRATVSRSGTTTTAVTVTLAASPSGQIVLPAQITIPAGESSATFTISGVADDLPEGSQSIRLTAQAADVTDANATLIVTDTDRPHLVFELPAQTVMEGSSITGILRRDFVTTNDVIALIANSDPAHLLTPLSVTIPKNLAQASFTLSASDNSIIEPNATVTLTASAPGFANSATSMSVIDNDSPTLTLKFALPTVSESAGGFATTATLTRSAITAQPLYFTLQSSNPSKAVVPATIVIPAFESEATFAVGVRDDAVINNNQLVTISATLVNAGTSIPVGPVAKATLEVTDDESPSLSLSVSRGSAREGTVVSAVVSRSGATDADLVVNLASSDTTEATVPTTVTIPAGTSSSEFQITTVNDGVPDGNQRATITASAVNFSKAIALITVTESDLPDLVITGIQLPPNAQNDGNVQIAYTISNVGSASFTGVALQRVSISRDAFIGDDVVIGFSEFNGTLAPGEQANRTFNITTPLAPGDYWLIVEADNTRLVAESVEDNNGAISRNALLVRSAYFATVHTDIDIAPANTVIPLTGVARGPAGGPAPFVPVSIFVDVAGTRRVVPATSGSDGTFSATFQPLPGEAGHYEISASHPTVTNTPPQDTFTLVGMRIQPDRISHQIASMAGVTNTVNVVNASDVALTGLNATVVGSSPALDVSIDLGSDLDGSATVPLTYRIRSLENQAITGTLIIHVASAQGAIANLPIDLTVVPPEPVLVVKPAALAAGMIRGSQSILEFAVVNQGGAETGPIDVALPPIPWLHAATALPLPNLLPGQTNKIILQLTPDPNLPLGPNTGTLLVSSARSRTAVPFSFVSLSSAVGDLRVSVEDEFTYYAAGSPKVTNALVTLRDPVTTETVTNGFTGADGQIFFGGLREAYYNVEVTADKHTTFRRAVLVSAGKENDLTAFISRQAVQYVWTVVPTTIEDRTRITIQTVFETVVPMPVITLDPPFIDLADIQGDVAQVDVKITNHGLIAAQEMNLNFPSHPAWQIQPLVTNIGAVAAQQTISIPVLIRRITSAPATAASANIAQSPPAVGPCVINGTADWSLQCGGQKNKYGASISAINANPDCLLGGGGGGTPGGTSAAGQSGATGFSSQPTPAGPGVSSIAFFPPEPPILEQRFSCGPCNEKTFEPDKALSIDISGLFKFIGPIVEGAIETQSGGLAHPKVTIKASGGIQTCCKEGNQGYELFGAATAGLELGIGPVVDKSASLTVTLESDPPVVAKVSGSLKYGVELSGGLSLSGIVTSGCGTGTEVTLSATADVGLFAGVTGEVKATIEGGPLSGQTKPVSINGSLNGHASLTVTYADGKVTTSICSQGIYYTAMGSILSKTFNLFDAEKNYIVEPYCPGGAEKAMFVGELEKAALEEIKQKYVPILLARARATAQQIPNTTVAGSSSLAAAPAYTGVKAASDEGVCARVRLRLDQDLVMTRNAFNATLELINNTEGTPLENISVQVNVITTNGVDANNLFGLRSPQLSGALTAVDGTGTLPGPSSGKSSWILIPTNEAAPDGPTQYAVGGLLTYVQDGHQVVVPLAPVSITVFPDASLRLKYFHQRDVLSDDPFTPLIEPAEPFVLGVLVQNSGKGEAKNVRITSAQPKIVENEKGLLIDFKIVGAQVGTNAVERSLTVNFGNIAPGTIGVGKWLLQASLQGQFIDYQASFEHIDELGDPRLSLIQGVEIHEMIRSVQADGAFEDGLPDFLVNDIQNGENLPDTLYLSDGRIMPVAVNLAATTDKTPTTADLVVHLTTSPSTGWTYLRIPNPGAGAFRLARVQRSDGRDLTVGTNAWVTDRTFIENTRRPINEWNLHLLDYDSAGSYSLYYEMIPSVTDAIPPVSSVTPLDPFNAQQFTVSWSGHDEAGGSGVAAFDIYVSENAGAFTRWLVGTHLTASVFQGIPGNRYGFYSIATDAAGNREQTPAAGQAQTEVTGNTAPAIGNISDITIVEGQTVRTTIAATDAEHDTIQFALGEAPPGMSIDSASGELTWITGEAHGPATYNISVQAQDSGSPRLISTRSFHVTVLETNSPPVLPAIPSAITVVEGVPIVIDASATDSDLPGNPLRYSLAPGAPAGATISRAGLFTWTPSEAQGGTTNTITIIVNDGGAPNLTDTRVITVVVLDQNSPPIITPIADQFLYEGDTLALTIGVTDPDIPANIVTLTLPSGAPNGVIFDPTQHTLKWSPTAAQTPSTNTFTVRATDNGQPPLTNTVSFQVEVVELKPGLNTPNFATDGAFEFRFKGSQGSNYVLQSSSDLVFWTDLIPFTATNWIMRMRDSSPRVPDHRFYRTKP